MSERGKAQEIHWCTTSTTIHRIHHSEVLLPKVHRFGVSQTITLCTSIPLRNNDV